MTTKKREADETPVTMADAAALNGVQPEPAPKDSVSTFISAGMASDLEQQGWTLDPLTGKKIVRE